MSDIAKLIAPYAEAGLAGLIFFGMIFLVIFVLRQADSRHTAQMKAHRDERDEWRQEMRKIADRADDREKETRQAYDKWVAVVSAINQRR